MEVFKEPKEEPKTKYFLKLEECPSGDGEVYLRMVDKNGNKHVSGTILSINKRGKLVLYPGIDADLGLALDSHGYIEKG